MREIEKVKFGMPKAGGAGVVPPIVTARPGFGAPPAPGGPDFPFEIPTAEFKPQVYIKDGTLEPLGNEAAMQGNITAEGTDEFKLRCEVPAVNGVYVDGDSDVRLCNTEIEVYGDCVNDFSGNGAGLQVMGNAKVVLENSRITSGGLLRSCLMADEYSTLIVKNCELICEGGEVSPDNPNINIPAGPGMTQAPPSMEVEGHSRLSLAAGNSHSYFYDCKVVSDAWAALSTDSSWGDTYLEANRCDITVKRPGYATFSDEGALVVFNDCNVKVASHAGMIAGKAKIFFNRTKVDSDKYGFLLFAVGAKGEGWQLSEVTLKECTIHTASDLFKIKGTNSYLDIRGCDITCENHCLIRTSDNHEDFMASTAAPGEDLYGIKAVFSDMTATGDIIHGDADRGMMVRLLHATLHGAVQNAWLDIDEASKWYATADSNVALTKSSEERIDAPDGVVITAECEESSEHRENTLKSGGKLIIN